MFLGNAGNTEVETGALPNRAFHPDAAAVGFHNVARDRESEAGAAGFAGPCGIDAVKSFEDALQIGLGNAYARVTDRENDFMPVRARLHFNLSAGGRVLQRVVEQILQDFAELRAIAANRRRVLLQVDMNLEPSRFRIKARRFDASVHQRFHADRANFEFEPARFDAREFQKVIGEPGKTARMIANYFDEAIAIGFIVQRAAEESFGKSLDRCQRRLEFMRDIGHKIGRAHV
jgi:hypothetical protein